MRTLTFLDLVDLIVVDTRLSEFNLNLPPTNLKTRVTPWIIAIFATFCIALTWLLRRVNRHVSPDAERQPLIANDSHPESSTERDEAPVTCAETETAQEHPSRTTPAPFYNPSPPSSPPKAPSPSPKDVNESTENAQPIRLLEYEIVALQNSSVASSKDDVPRPRSFSSGSGSSNTQRKDQPLHESIPVAEEGHSGPEEEEVASISPEAPAPAPAPKASAVTPAPVPAPAPVRSPADADAEASLEDTKKYETVTNSLLKGVDVSAPATLEAVQLVPSDGFPAEARPQETLPVTPTPLTVNPLLDDLTSQAPKDIAMDVDAKIQDGETPEQADTTTDPFVNLDASSTEPFNLHSDLQDSDHHVQVHTLEDTIRPEDSRSRPSSPTPRLPALPFLSRYTSAPVVHLAQDVHSPNSSPGHRSARVHARPRTMSISSNLSGSTALSTLSLASTSQLRVRKRSGVFSLRERTSFAGLPVHGVGLAFRLEREDENEAIVPETTAIAEEDVD